MHLLLLLLLLLLEQRGEPHLPHWARGWQLVTPWQQWRPLLLPLHHGLQAVVLQGPPSRHQIVTV